MSKTIDMRGQVFGKLTVIRKVPGIIQKWSGSTHGARWECQCSCGNVVSVVRTSLVHGTTKSCGCGQRGKRSGL